MKSIQIFEASSKHRGKLIEYHDWVDSGFTLEFAVEYYESVVHAMEKEGHGDSDAAALEETQDFYRLFVVPGMGHCSGGPGPNAFGGLAQPEVPMDSQHDLLSALEAWVEHGAARPQMIATKYTPVPVQLARQTFSLLRSPRARTAEDLPLWGQILAARQEGALPPTFQRAHETRLRTGPGDRRMCAAWVRSSGRP